MPNNQGGTILSVNDPKYRAVPACVEAWTTLTPQKIIAMTTVGDRVFVATDHRVYELIEGLWHPMKFAVERPPVPE